MAEVKGAIQAKSDSTGGVKINDAWLTVEENVKPFLAKVKKGDVVTVSTVKKGYKTFVTKLVVNGASEETQQEEQPAEFVCEDCGAKLKDGKYKKCYTCNKKNPVKYHKEEEESSSEEKPKQSSDISARIVRGNALNSATARLAGQSIRDLQASAEECIALAELFIPYLQGIE